MITSQVVGKMLPEHLTWSSRGNWREPSEGLMFQGTDAFKRSKLGMGSHIRVSNSGDHCNCRPEGLGRDGYGKPETAGVAAEGEGYSYWSLVEESHLQYFPGGPVVENPPSNARPWVQSLARELGSHMPEAMKPRCHNQRIHGPQGKIPLDATKILCAATEIWCSQMNKYK